MREIKDIYVNGVCLKDILELHKKWLNGEDGGIKANLQEVNLSETDLGDANLQGADLRGSDLSYFITCLKNIIVKL